MHRAGPGERGGGSYGRRAVAAAKGASMQISVDRKGFYYYKAVEINNIIKK